MTNLTSEDAPTEHIYYGLLLGVFELLGAFCASTYYSYIYHAQIEDRKNLDDWYLISKTFTKDANKNNISFIKLFTESIN